MKKVLLTVAVLCVVLTVATLPHKAQAATADYFDTVQQVYIGYYQRPADPGGLLYWAQRLDTTNGNLNEIIEAYANSAESQALYGTINSSNIGTVVNSIYMALFNRPAEVEGKAYYVNGFNTGRFTAATIMLNVLYGAQNKDLLSVNNKVTASSLFTRTIDPGLDGRDFQYSYSGNADAQRARDFLSTVTSDPATIPTEDEIREFLEPTVGTGDFWEFRWDYYHSSWGGGSTTDTGRFWIVLGQPLSINGITAYQVLTYGKSKGRDSFTYGFGPRWNYIAFSDNRILGSLDGVSLVTIMDAQTGGWAGGGFFTSFPEGKLVLSRNGTISNTNTYISGDAIVAQFSGSKSECEVIAGVTICGDDSYGFDKEEYYRSGIGPVGYYYTYSYMDCGGGFCSGGTWKENVGLTASSFTGQSNPLMNEIEPSDSPATAQPISMGRAIIGNVSDSAYANLGNTVINVNVVDDNGNSVNITSTVEDWYSFTLTAAKTVTITLSFEGSPTADLDVYLMNSTGTSLYGYSIHDNPAKYDQHEKIITNLGPGSYRIGVDGYFTPSSVKYTLGVE